jgi:hypothetical protein
LKDSTPAHPEIHQQPRTCLLVFLVVLAHLCLVLPLAAKLNIWIDEAYSLATTDHGMGHALRQGLYFELQPPFYYLLLNAWRRAAVDSVLFARLLSVAISVATIIVAAGLAQRYLERIHPALVALVTAFHPLVVYSAVEIRGYSLILLLSGLILLLFHDAFLSDDRSRLSRGAYVFVSCLALYTQYYLGFLLAANGLALLVLRRWRDLKRYALAMALVAVVFVPLAAILPGQVAGHTDSITADEPLVEDIKRVVWRNLEYAAPTWWMGELDAWTARNVIAVVIAVLGALAVLFRWRDATRPGFLALGTMAATVSLGFVVVSGLVSDQLLLVNHTAALFFPSILFAFRILDGLKPRAIHLLWVVFVLVLDGFALAQTYRPMAKPGDYQRAARLIMEQERPGEPILIFTPEAALALARYYSGPNDLVPIPAPEDLKIYDVSEFALTSEDDIRSALGDLQDDPARLWLYNEVRSPCSYLGVQLNCRILEDFVANHYVVRLRQPLHRGQVRLLEPKAPRTP